MPTNYHSHNHSHNHKVQEYRAPTDESVRLLKELEEKALEKVLATYVVKEPNLLNGVVVAYIASADVLSTMVFTKFNLNGREYKLKTELPMLPGLFNRDEMKRLLVEKMSQAIALKIIEELNQL